MAIGLRFMTSKVMARGPEGVLSAHSGRQVGCAVQVDAEDRNVLIAQELLLASNVGLGRLWRHASGPRNPLFQLDLDEALGKDAAYKAKPSLSGLLLVTPRANPTSFVKRQVAARIESQQEQQALGKRKHSAPSASVSLAGTSLTSPICGSVVFDLTFCNTRANETLFCDITAHTVILYVLFCLTYMYCTLYILYILDLTRLLE